MIVSWRISRQNERKIHNNLIPAPTKQTMCVGWYSIVVSWLSTYIRRVSVEKLGVLVGKLGAISW